MTQIIELNDRKHFRALLNPVRQDIIHLLRRAARPMTVSQVAERMLLSPSAAQVHLNRLAELGVVEQVAVSGRPAALYRLADVEIRLSLGRKDGFQGEREALAAEFADAVFRDTLETARRYSEAEAEENCLFSVGAAHLTRREREELAGLVRDYLSTHRVPTPEAEEEHWEFVLMARRAPGEAEPRR